MNQALRDQIWAMAQQEGAEFYEGFAGSPNSISFKEDEFWRFVSQLWQEAYDRGHYDGHNDGYDAGHYAAEIQSTFEARNQE
jgi:hypothetical protein